MIIIDVLRWFTRFYGRQGNRLARSVYGTFESLSTFTSQRRATAPRATDPTAEPPIREQGKEGSGGGAGRPGAQVRRRSPPW